jgi:hypothetical protein
MLRTVERVLQVVLITKEPYNLARARKPESIYRMKSICKGTTELAITRAANCEMVGYARER